MTRAKTFHLHIETAAASWRRVRGLNARLNKAVVMTVSLLPKNLQKVAKNTSVTLLLTSDEAVRRLNHDFRGKNKPTNVLSFPAFTKQELKMYKLPSPCGRVEIAKAISGRGKKETPSPAITRDLLRKSKLLLPLPQGERDSLYMGDIAIAYRFTADEARKERKILKNHVTHLLIHGLLHLFGYDHDTNAASVKMERLEKKIMAALGLPDPYAPFE